MLMLMLMVGRSSKSMAPKRNRRHKGTIGKNGKRLGANPGCQSCGRAVSEEGQIVGWGGTR